MTEPPDEPQYEPVYRAVIPEDAHPELIEEEFDLYQRMLDRLGDRVPDECSPEESQALLSEAVGEDPELAAIVERLGEVTRTHKGSVLRRLMEADMRSENSP